MTDEPNSETPQGAEKPQAALPEKPEPKKEAPKDDDREWLYERNERVAKSIAKDPELVKDMMTRLQERGADGLDQTRKELNDLRMEITVERALRMYELTDDDKELIEAATPDAVMAKAAKLAKRNAEKKNAEDEAKHFNFPEPKEDQYSKDPFERTMQKLEHAAAAEARRQGIQVKPGY